MSGPRNLDLILRLRQLSVFKQRNAVVRFMFLEGSLHWVIKEDWLLLDILPRQICHTPLHSILSLPRHNTNSSVLSFWLTWSSQILSTESSAQHSACVKV